MAAHYGGSGATPITSIAYLRYVTQMYMTPWRIR
jgi:hypothetical protein